MFGENIFSNEIQKQIAEAKSLGVDREVIYAAEEVAANANGNTPEIIKLNEAIEAARPKKEVPKIDGRTKGVKVRKTKKNPFTLAGVIYKDTVFEISTEKLSDADKKRLERSFELGLIEKV